MPHFCGCVLSTFSSMNLPSSVSEAWRPLTEKPRTRACCSGLTRQRRSSRQLRRTCPSTSHKVYLDHAQDLVLQQSFPRDVQRKETLNPRHRNKIPPLWNELITIVQDETRQTYNLKWNNTELKLTLHAEIHGQMMRKSKQD